MARRFEKDDVVIPRQYLKDKDWRASTIVVVEQEWDGTLIAFPSAGGFRLRIPADKVEEFDFIKVPQEMLERSPFHKARFTADWMPEGKSYVGWTTGQLWNGWGMPSFEKVVADEVVADLDGWKVTFDPEKDQYTLISENEDEPYIVQGATIQVEDRGRRKKIKVYDIGSGYLTWNAPEYL